jgi:hypothetical protein
MTRSIDYNDTACLNKEFIKDMKGDAILLPRLRHQLMVYAKLWVASLVLSHDRKLADRTWLQSMVIALREDNNHLPFTISVASTSNEILKLARLVSVGL